MNNHKRLKKFVPLYLALLLLSSFGLAIKAGIAEAKPPKHSSARGYRCQHHERDRKSNRSDCGRYDDRYKDYDHYDRSQYSRGRLYARSVLPVEYSGSQRIIIKRDENFPLTLRISRNLTDEQNRVLIPRDSVVEGEFRPARDGMRFVARRLILSNDKSYRLDAESRMIYRDRNLIFEDLDNVRVSDAAKILIDSITRNGRIRTDDSDLFVVYPGSSLDLTLKSDCEIN